MATTLQDILNATNDIIGSYSTGIIDNDIKIRAINRSFEFIKRTLGIPSDEDIQTILFSADQKYYDLNADVDEGIMVLYTDDARNTEQNRWEYFNYPDILGTAGVVRGNRWSITYINGKKQLVLHANNIGQGKTLFNFDSVINWLAGSDASGIVQDTNQMYEGSGSLSYDIVKSAGTAKIYNSTDTKDLTTEFERHGYVKFWHYLTDDNISAITLKLSTDGSNYYSITATVADDGTAFTQDAWQKVGFSLDDAIITGSPDPSNLKIEVQYTLGAGFVSAADFRIDSMFSSIPDSVDLIYYTAYKGTDTTGVTKKTTLNLVTDIASFSGMNDDLLEAIAQRAAINLWPQLKGDKDFFMLLQQDFQMNIKSFARRFPRKRVQGQYKHYLRR